ISPGGFEVLLKAIGDVRPVGVCGSGLISGLSALERAGVIDRSGRFSPGLNTPRFRIGADGREFVLAWASESGSSRDLVLTNADLQNLLRAKAAVFAGIQTLLRSVGLGKDDIEQVLIGGGFGRHLNVRDAVAIGMLPDLPPERFRFVGNSSLGGARLALLSAADRTVIEATARRVTYMELDETTPFMDEFMAAMFLPHTDIGLFPSVKD
ncbi:MAG: ATP-binding protein, partial [Eubacteriales bacterium]|nr:ATP-binding protein [Eubacteriales bacterium]